MVTFKLFKMVHLKLDLVTKEIIDASIADAQGLIGKTLSPR